MKEYGEILENVSLKKYNTYNIGGNARYIIKPYNVGKLIELIKFLKENNYKYFVLGKGSNVILPDENYDGVVILLDNLNKVSINKNTVIAETGIPLTLLINKLIDNNLGGLEKLCGIPGTLGGAVVGNAGCNGSTISDFIISITYLENNIIKTIKKEDCNFKYRSSIFKGNKKIIVLSVKFNLINKNKDEMREIVKINMTKRKSSQPLEYPNAGSVFKNPTDMSAGKLIEDANLKNYHINDAYVSDKHANFIINKGNATKKDIVNLINFIKQEIKRIYDIDLELEQIIIEY